MISPSGMCTTVPADSDGVQDWGDLAGPQEKLLWEPQVAASVSELKALRGGVTLPELQVEELSPALSDLDDGDDIAIELDMSILAVKLTSDPGCVSSILESPGCKLVGTLLPVSSSAP